MSAVVRNNVQVVGPVTGPTLVLAHGFGCSQGMWRHVTADLARDHRVVLFDHVGAGDSDPRAYDPTRHATLAGYAEDVVAILRELGVGGVTYVGHSVGAMIGVLASRLAPEWITDLVLVGPSPRYLDDPATGYVGGFDEADMTELLGLLDRNHAGWASAMAPTIMGNADRPELAEEWSDSVCRTDPVLARRFARATFLGDNRADLPQVTARTLVLQSARDAIAPPVVGRYVADAIPGAVLRELDVSGHCPNLSAPQVTAQAIRDFAALPV
ncbi:alpha/beta fold hydrolase [Egicoccus halophilus]|uniref:Hydrolase n=1 Tax=Egicoccus halophilus TaxID=1670830 RepID=A0A8J3ESC8_9ACTN|nr:alpha/beta hydrolase [Egicoccus halophilus]GGI02784.1 hydrolase [Egicoccus halophilus]